jgi:hypothetical protein
VLQGCLSSDDSELSEREREGHGRFAVIETCSGSHEQSDCSILIECFEKLLPHAAGIVLEFLSTRLPSERSSRWSIEHLSQDETQLLIDKKGKYLTYCAVGGILAFNIACQVL